MKINENGYIEPEIGDKFKIPNKPEIQLITVEGGCEKCFFKKRHCPTIACLDEERSDEKQVAFKGIEND